MQKIEDANKLKKIEEAFNKQSFNPSTGFNEFYKAIDMSEMIPGDDAEKLFQPDPFRKLFTHNSHTSRSTVMTNDERQSMGQRELWQLGQTSWQHNLTDIRSDRK